MFIPLFIIILFLAGLFFYAKYGPSSNSSSKLLEGLTSIDNGEPRCPNVLIQKGLQYYLYNSRIAKVPGVNPIEFANLEDYVEFINWQRSQGIRCPVLYLQHTYDAQGNPSYKVRPNVTELQGGLPPSTLKRPNPTLLYDANHNDFPYNKNSIPSYDNTSQYVGSTTPLDAMDETQENMLYSPNAMNDNWGGQDYTQSLVDSGFYKGNEVSIRV